MAVSQSAPQTAPESIGIFGGAFAPFHNGHLRLALEVKERLGLAQVRLLPTAHPPHRLQPKVSPQRRLEWLKAAIRKEKGLVADDRELRRTGTSYTIDTLLALQEAFPHSRLVLILGADAFAHFHTWHRWQEIVTLAHLAVVSRPGSALSVPKEAVGVLAAQPLVDASQWQKAPWGSWSEVVLPAMEISSTRIRRLLKSGQSVRGLLPDAILNTLSAQDLALLIQDEQSTTH
jgi:nicotinate-nucleotide adenylyltransferase